MNNNKVVKTFMKIEKGRKVELFSFWLQLFDNLYSDSSLPSGKSLHLLQWDLTGKVSTSNKQNNRMTDFFLKIFSFLFFYFYLKLKRPFGFIPGGTKSKKIIAIDRISMFFCRTYLRSINPTFCIKNKDTFILDLKNNNNLKPDYIEKLESTIPDVFFCESFADDSIPKVFYGSPVALFSYPWVYLILLNNIKINGIIHGGFYDELRENNIQEYEKNISDNYIGWGLSKYNIVQNRFKIKKLPKVDITSVTIVGAKNNLSKNMNWMYPDFENISIQAERNYSHFINEFSSDLTIFYRPSRYQKYDNEFRIFSDVNINNKLSGTIFLFDKPCSTFFYKCVYSNLPFVMYFNENWLKYFTNKYVDLLLYLKSNNLLFFWGEELKMKACITIIVDDSRNNLYSNAKVIDYFESKKNFDLY